MPNVPESSQLAKNSNEATPVPVAIFEAEQTVSYQTLPPRALRRAKFTAEPQTYAVEITGTERDYGKSDLLAGDVRWQEIFHEYHPCLAVGRAVIAFLGVCRVRTIKDINICRVVVKPSKKK